MLSKKQIKKIRDRKCYFCEENDINLLDAHRIIPGSEGGKYTDWNSLTTCATCHRKCHSGRIKILGKYKTSAGRPVLHYLEDGQENWK